MRIFSIKRQAINLVIFGMTLVALNVVNFNYLIENDDYLINIVDLWARASIEVADGRETGEIIHDAENADFKALAGKIIAVDPGHGGIDKGASGYGQKEKDINLKIAVKLSQELQNNGATVVLTRREDVDYYTRGMGGKRNDLLKRSQIIKESGAQVFVSIHCNSTKEPGWSGAQVFYNSKIEGNKELAEIMQQALKNFPPGNKRQAKQDSHIFLLKSINVPGILIETGFISNPKEAKALGAEEYQEIIAKSIAKGLVHHFSRNGVR